MKIARLLPFLSGLPAWLLSICVFLSCGCGHEEGSAEKARQARLQEVIEKLSAIQARLEHNEDQAQDPRTLSKEQLREAFQPLADVLARVVERQQQDRQQWLAVVADVRRLSQLVSAGVARKEQAELQAMRERLDQVEARLHEQGRRSREAKEALIQALDAASGRLDNLLKELDAAQPGRQVGGDRPGDKGAGGTTGSANGTGAGSGSGTGSGSKPDGGGKRKDEGAGKGTGDGREAGKDSKAAEDAGASNPLLVTLLAIGVAVVVGWLVFFPGGRQPTVSRMQRAARAEPEHIEDAEATEIQGTGDEIDVGSEAESGIGSGAETTAETRPGASTADAADVRGAQVVELDVACEDPEVAAERVAGLLSAEPRVLLHPEPEIQAREGSLALRFYLAPSLSGDQRSLIQTAVQALAGERAPPGAGDDASGAEETNGTRGTGGTSGTGRTTGTGEAGEQGR